MTARPDILVRCDAPQLHTGAPFTHGRTYRARPYRETRLYVLACDAGHPRFFLPDEPCAHLPPQARIFSSAALGTFRTVGAP